MNRESRTLNKYLRKNVTVYLRSGEVLKGFLTYGERVGNLWINTGCYSVAGVEFHKSNVKKIERNVLTMDMALPKTCDDCPMDLVACTRLYAPENAKRPKGQIPSWCPWRETTVESDKIYNGRREDRT